MVRRSVKYVTAIVLNENCGMWNTNYQRLTTVDFLFNFHKHVGFAVPMVMNITYIMHVHVYNTWGGDSYV